MWEPPTHKGFSDSHFDSLSLGTTLCLGMTKSSRGPSHNYEPPGHRGDARRSPHAEENYGFYLAKLTRVSTGGKREQRRCLAKRMRRGRIDSITIRDEKRKFISDIRDVVFAVNNNVVGVKVAGCFPQLR